jgi:hypothetical protein
MSALTDFLLDDGCDASGRKHGEILELPDDSLEKLHDYIQWLFPLPEPSSAVPSAPVMTDEDIEALRASRLTRNRMLQAMERMLRFYSANNHWLRPHDHNHLRITRIIRSLRLLVDDETANQFFSRIIKWVQDTKAPISSTSLAYWRAA